MEPEAGDLESTARRTPAGDAFSAMVVRLIRLQGFLSAAGDALARPSGQSTARWQVLAVVENGSVTVADIARALTLARQSVQRVADILAAEGLVVYEAIRAMSGRSSSASPRRAGSCSRPSRGHSGAGRTSSGPRSAWPTSSGSAGCSTRSSASPSGIHRRPADGSGGRSGARSALGRHDLDGEILSEQGREAVDRGEQRAARRAADLVEPGNRDSVRVEPPGAADDPAHDDERRDPAGLTAHRATTPGRDHVLVGRPRPEHPGIEPWQEAHRVAGAVLLRARQRAPPGHMPARPPRRPRRAATRCSSTIVLSHAARSSRRPSSRGTPGTSPGRTRRSRPPITAGAAAAGRRQAGPGGAGIRWPAEGRPRATTRAEQQHALPREGLQHGSPAGPKPLADVAQPTRGRDRLDQLLAAERPPGERRVGGVAVGVPQPGVMPK